jgi:hypothetical protein
MVWPDEQGAQMAIYAALTYTRDVDWSAPERAE